MQVAADLAQLDRHLATGIRMIFLQQAISRQQWAGIHLLGLGCCNHAAAPGPDSIWVVCSITVKSQQSLLSDGKQPQGFHAALKVHHFKGKNHVAGQGVPA